MNVKFAAFQLIVIVLGISVANGQSTQEFNPSSAEYLWPTEASGYLTSTFAETRSQHFHAALDIKTWGRRGYEVYATRDGTIDRVAIGPRGYGKVIYLKHNDGSYSVYAHLLSFYDELQQMIDEERLAQDYQFEIERFWGWKNITVEQGDLIGYSGASGIGPPHLHFELRTPTHKPFNPLLTNLTVEDNIPPQFSALSIEPLAPSSSINGKNEIVTKKPRRNGNNYQFGTVTTSGPIGLGINVFDQSNGVYNTYAVYELSLSIDGKEFFKARADSFSYGETDQMFLDRVYPLLQQDKGGFQRLFITDGNTLPFYETSKGKGRLNLNPGDYTANITATDFFGNASTASLTLQVRESDAFHPTFPFSSNEKQITAFQQPHTWNWFSDWLTLSDLQFQQITIANDNSDHFYKHQNGVAIDLQKRDPLFMNIPGMGAINFRRIFPGKKQIISTADQQHFAIFPAHTFYDTISAGMAVQQRAPDAIQVDLIPEAYPARKSFQFYIARDSALADTAKLSFYKNDRFDDDEKWERIPTTFTKEHIIGEAESLGTFVTKRDTIPPNIENPRLQQRADNKWILLIDATDNLSEIDYKKTRISVNGVRGIAEFEPEDDRFVYYRPDFAPSDTMKVDITAYDKEGNKNTAVFYIEE